MSIFRTHSATPPVVLNLLIANLVVFLAMMFFEADMLRFESAKDRYTKLMQHSPEIVRRAPLTYIASYLQMTLETLSRVRASIA